MLSPSATICLIGFGEAGSILGADLARRGCALRSYDVLLDSPGSRALTLQRMQAAGVDAASTPAAAVQGAKLVISAVGAKAASDVARSAAALLQPGQIFLEINSLPAATRRGNAAVISGSGALYMEAAVTQPLRRLRLATPLLLAGARAAELAPALNALGFNASATTAQIGELAEIAYYSPTAGHGREDGSPAAMPARRGELP
jgi:3-hydroxyisobutyrate dehydrogenase-like beta-hydroxyacid dehydrogenase